jgi:hypothetical protein
VIELSSLVWLVAILWGIFGFLRGWQRETPVLAAGMLGLLLLIQGDAIIRGLLNLLRVSTNVSFFIQVGLYVIIIYAGYRMRDNVVLGDGGRRELSLNSASSWLGGLFGAVNGWLIAGTVWYLMDINEYPIDQFFGAPSLNSPSADMIGSMPVMLLTLGGTNMTVLLLLTLVAAVLAAASS